MGLKANETLSKATIDWLWESGEADQIGKHSSVLVGGSLIEGDYPQVNFDPAPKLKSGAWYVVTYNGTDRAGNSATFTWEDYFMITFLLKYPVYTHPLIRLPILLK